MARLAVAAFGRRLAPETTDTITATRFLRSKGLRRIQSIDEVDALAQSAVTMYRKYLEWRKAEKVDELLQEPPPPAEVEKVFVRTFNPQVLEGVDFHGRPACRGSVPGASPGYVKFHHGRRCCCSAALLLSAHRR